MRHKINKVYYFNDIEKSNSVHNIGGCCNSAPRKHWIIQLKYEIMERLQSNVRPAVRSKQWENMWIHHKSVLRTQPVR